MEIVRRSGEVDRKYLQLVRQYTYVERQENRQFDSQGKVKEHESRTWDVTLLEGSIYRRLLQKDDKPLPPKEEEKEREKLRRSIEQRQKETEAQRQARLAEAEHRLQRRLDTVKEVPEAFNLKLEGEEFLNGAATWVIELTPKPGYKPHTAFTQFFPKLKGKIWIAKADYQWVKVEAESIDAVMFGLVLARVAKGATIRIVQTRVNNEVWLPLRVDISATARIALVRLFRGQIEFTYKDYKKFQAESHIVATEPK